MRGIYPQQRAGGEAKFFNSGIFGGYFP